MFLSILHITYKMSDEKWSLDWLGTRGKPYSQQLGAKYNVDVGQFRIPEAPTTLEESMQVPERWNWNAELHLSHSVRADKYWAMLNGLRSIWRNRNGKVACIHYETVCWNRWDTIKCNIWYTPSLVTMAKVLPNNHRRLPRQWKLSKLFLYYLTKLCFTTAKASKMTVLRTNMCSWRLEKIPKRKSINLHNKTFRQLRIFERLILKSID